MTIMLGMLRGEASSRPSGIVIGTDSAHWGSSSPSAIWVEKKQPGQHRR